jgi:hypothetical protein
MRSSIEAVVPSLYRQAPSGQVALFYSETPTDVKHLHQALEASGAPFREEAMPGPPPWREIKTIVNGGAPFAVVERIVETLQ